jgi:hypothetical protein
MIMGQILLNGVTFSNHRFPEGRYTVALVQQLLAELTAAESLHELGKVDIQVHSQRGLERLMAALWGKSGDANNLAS